MKGVQRMNRKGLNAHPRVNKWGDSNQNWRKYHGVRFEHGMFHALLALPHSRTVSLGFYDTAVEAAVAYDRGVRVQWGGHEKKHGKKHGGNGGRRVVPTNFEAHERPLTMTAKGMGEGYVVTAKVSGGGSGSRVKRKGRGKRKQPPPAVSHRSMNVAAAAAAAASAASAAAASAVAASAAAEAAADSSRSVNLPTLKGRSRHRLCSSPNLSIE
jgi:hypothetical protein